MSTIDISSTTSVSTSSRFWPLRSNEPRRGSNSSRRWRVSAGVPVLSLRRFAARPVGAASATWRRFAASSVTMAR
jgi:hypothetical protein